MNPATKRLAAMSREVAAAYALNPKVEVVTLVGSVASGRADSNSDIDLFIFWNKPPTDNDRLKAVTRAGGRIDIRWRQPPSVREFKQIMERAGGKLGQLFTSGGEGWAEQFDVRGVTIGVHGLLSATTDRYLQDVIDKYDTSAGKHTLIYTIRTSQPLHGHARFKRWQAKAAKYPNELAAAVVTELLDLDRNWWECDLLARRDDWLLLYRLLEVMAHKILRILLALNRIYLHDPRLKWLEQLIKQLQIKPRRLSARLRTTFRLEPLAAVQEIQQLFEETLNLVAVHLTEVDTAFARKWYRHRGVR